MSIQTEKLAALARQYPELFKIFDRKILEYLTDFIIEKKGKINNESFMNHLRMEADLPPAEMEKIKKELDNLPRGKGLAEFGEDIYTAVEFSGDGNFKNDLVNVLADIGAYFAIAGELPPVDDEIFTKNRVESGMLSERQSINSSRKISGEIARPAAISQETKTVQQVGESGARSRKKAKLAGRMPQLPISASGTRNEKQTGAAPTKKRKKSLFGRLGKIAVGATAVGFGGGLYWAGTSTAQVFDIFLK
ncbi:hypothetical protein HYW82_00170 [Candidatus Peregrinibacteria bacterium]|nr:hypothetical protein [Candidatus Peregrinibacteria bacterium]